MDDGTGDKGKGKKEEVIPPPRLRRSTTSTDKTKQQNLRKILKQKYFPDFKIAIHKAIETNNFKNILDRFNRFVNDPEAQRERPDLSMDNLPKYLGYTQSLERNTVIFVEKLDRSRRINPQEIDRNDLLTTYKTLYKRKKSKPGQDPDTKAESVNKNLDDLDQVFRRFEDVEEEGEEESKTEDKTEGSGSKDPLPKEDKDILEVLEPGATQEKAEPKEDPKPPEEEARQTDDNPEEDTEPELQEDPPPQQNIIMEVRKEKEEQNKQREKPIEDTPQFRAVDNIPESRLTTEEKDENQLKDDIRYFFKTFPDKLKRLNNSFKKLDGLNLLQLRRFHRRIVSLLNPSKKTGLGTKTGVIIDAEEYIRQKVNEIMIDNALSQFRPEQLAPISEGNEDENKGDTKDVGSYEVKTNRSGKLTAQREPIYKYIPPGEPPKDYIKERRRIFNKVKLPSKKRTVVSGAKDRFNNDPFTEKTKSRRINLLY
jgi:hypothetical protein